MGIIGIILLLGLAYALSLNRSAINWRTVGGAFAIQASIGAFILYSELFKRFTAKVNDIY